MNVEASVHVTERLRNVQILPVVIIANANLVMSLTLTVVQMVILVCRQVSSLIWPSEQVAPRLGITRIMLV